MAGYSFTAISLSTGTWRVDEFLGLDRCTDIEIDKNKVTPFPEDGFT